MGTRVEQRSTAGRKAPSSKGKTKAPSAKVRANGTAKLSRKLKIIAPPIRPDAKFQAAGATEINKLSLGEVDKNATPWSPEVRAMLVKYGAGDVLDFNRPIERLLTQAATIDQIFSAAYKSDSGLFQGLIEKDARRTVFMLEGLLKLYAKELGNKGEALLANVKGLEDNLGNISLQAELLKVAKEAKLPGTVIDELNRRNDKQRLDTEDFVVELAQTDAKGRTELIGQVIKTVVDHQNDFRSYEGDRRHALERLAKHMRALATDDYDMTQPATGNHELRRQIRWLPVDIEGLNGLVQLSTEKNPVDAYKSMLDTDLAKSKYVNLPGPAREPEAIQVSKSLYTKMMDVVLKLGAIKDHYEPLALLADLYVEMGLSPSVTAARLKLDPLLDPQNSEQDYQNQATAVFDEMRKNDLFGAMAKEYEDAAASLDVADWSSKR